jgi:branched-chain amino acid transport system permease protein
MKTAFAFGGILLALILAKYELDTYYLTLLIPALAYAIALFGLNLLFGYGGLLSLGHAMFVAAGAYVPAILGTRLGIHSFELQLLTALAVGTSSAALIGLLCARYSGIFFSMLTLAFSMIFHSFLFKFYALTGGESGMPVPKPSLLGVSFSHIGKTAFLVGPFYWYVLSLFTAAFALAAIVGVSSFGVTLRATRENPLKTQFLGVDVFKIRYITFILSGALSAIAGAILGVSIGAADPELGFWTQSGNMIFIIVLGGLGQLFGPIVGAIGFNFLQDALMANTQYWRSALGVALALLIIFAPGGLIGLARRFLPKVSFDGKIALRAPRDEAVR